MAEFLLELASEEIPARMQARARDALRQRAAAHLDAAGLAVDTLTAHVTPRRLVLVADGLPAKQPDATKETRGPKVGSPDKAVQGFLRANGLESVEQAEVREEAKGRFYHAVRHVEGRPTPEVLAEIVPALVRELPWPKTMRWGTHALRYVRPLHSVLALFDGRPVPGELDLGDTTLPFGRVTRGHPFLAPDPITVESARDHAASLHAAHVMLDSQARARRIHEQAETLAGREGLQVRRDDGLLAENAGMVEWPVVHMGTIDDRFMRLPPEVLATSMRTHQKYFATQHPDGTLANRFLLVANIETPDGGASIVAGNERVLRARLADAAFFWDQDRARPLRERVGDLAGVVFHAKLGTVHDKVDRLTALAPHLAASLGADRDMASSAALLAKADLTTAMVDEFPELEGLMGGYYAEADGERGEVARAVARHYQPEGPSDACPAEPAAVAVALADKLDTLTGFFAIGETPTGSKDPFALRRAALGVIRLIADNGHRVALAPIVREAIRLHGDTARAALRERAAHGEGETVPGETALVRELLGFLAERLKVVLRERGVRHDLIAACFAVEKPGGGPEDDLVRLLNRVDALRRFLGTDDGANLLTAYRRASRIVKKEKKDINQSLNMYANQQFLSYYIHNQENEIEEKNLWESLMMEYNTTRDTINKEDFEGAMRSLSLLRGPIDQFFNNVRVTVDQPSVKLARLGLLLMVQQTIDQVAHFAQIEG